MAVALFLAAIVTAANQVWWAAILLLGAGCACTHDTVTRQRAGMRQCETAIQHHHRTERRG